MGEYTVRRITDYYRDGVGVERGKHGWRYSIRVPGSGHSTIDGGACNKHRAHQRGRQDLKRLRQGRGVKTMFGLTRGVA